MGTSKVASICLILLFVMLQTSTVRSEMQEKDRESMPSACSPSGRYLAVSGKAADGYHDAIWLNDRITSRKVDLLAPANKYWSGIGGVSIKGWLDDDMIAFTKSCGTGCTSFEMIDVQTRTLRYFCTDARIYLSPDLLHIVGQSGGPLGRTDKRGGLALVKIGPESGSVNRQNSCLALIHGFDQCWPYQQQQSEAVNFERWAADGRSFIYAVTPCVKGHWQRPYERVFNVESNAQKEQTYSGRIREAN